MVRSDLEFSNSVWSPYKVGLIETIEKCKNVLPEWCLVAKVYHIPRDCKFLGIPTLKNLRHRGDMIETFKILHFCVTCPAIVKRL